jgi:uncharacterized protein
MIKTERISVLDALRGFALCGVLLSNFNSYTSQQVPAEVLEKSAGMFDGIINRFFGIFVEWKFMTLFSILFGSGFYILFENLKQRFHHPEFVYLKRLLFLFLLGLIHISFWWFDVLHLYAISGVWLLLIYRMPSTQLLVFSLVLMFPVTHFTGLYLSQFPPIMSDSDYFKIYLQFKNGMLSQLIQANWEGYFKLFVASGSNYRDIPETVGRFAFGYWLMQGGWLVNFENNIKTYHNWFFIFPAMTLFYFVQIYFRQQGVHFFPKVLDGLFLKAGLWATTCSYALIFLLVYTKLKNTPLMAGFAAVGRMTLTWYLCVSASMIALLYGIGMGLLGEVTVLSLFLLAFLFMPVIMWVSLCWFRYFRYGPVEWLWRQFTYGSNFSKANK